jgi:hypothetical protein
VLIPFSLREEIRPMMGERRVMREALFYGFSLERHVPDNHLAATAGARAGRSSALIENPALL